MHKQRWCQHFRHPILYGNPRSPRFAPCPRPNHVVHSSQGRVYMYRKSSFYTPLLHAYQSHRFPSFPPPECFPRGSYSSDQVHTPLPRSPILHTSPPARSRSAGSSHTRQRAGSSCPWAQDEHRRSARRVDNRLDARSSNTQARSTATEHANTP